MITYIITEDGDFLDTEINQELITEDSTPPVGAGLRMLPLLNVGN